MMILTTWSRERALNRPMKFNDATLQRSLRNTRASRPFVQREPLAVVGNQADCSLVPVLLFLDRPAHIARLVVPVVVRETVNRVLRRGPRPDVGEKGSERSAPFLADANPSATVVLEIATRRRVASVLHIDPSAMFRRARHGIAVPPIEQFAEVFAPMTAARARVSTPQVSKLNDGGHATVASAHHPAHTGLRGSSFGAHDEPTEPVARRNDQPIHNPSITREDVTVELVKADQT